MEIFLGEEGLNKSWQEKFSKTIKCHKCGGNARIMFVGREGFEELNKTMKGVKIKFICNLHENEPDEEKYWLHDCCAVAVYLCGKCFEPNAIINQA